MPAAEITLNGQATITSPLLLAETVMMLGMTKLQLARIPLERVLEKAAARNRRTGANGSREPAQANCLTDLIVALQTAERFLLRRDTCLLRSLALHAMLARRKLPATLVFGVKLHPFEAHCWVQRGQTLVNDTVERVGLFVPIRAVT
ncbi:MAG: lasso peptide biosynthesis B2 protein [Novosphingobium sp.]